MPIENRNLEPGTVLTARYKKEERTCEVVQTDDGLRYKLDNGELFTSPSSAGKAAMGGTACNGWRFWSIAGTETPRREPKAKKEPKTKPEPKAKSERTAKTSASAKTAPKKSAKAKVAKKPKAPRAAAKGDSYGCGACGESFPTMKAATAHALTHTG